MKKGFRKFAAITGTVALIGASLAGCGKNEKTPAASDNGVSTPAESKDEQKTQMTSEEIIKAAAAEGKVGNWGLGNEYEILALLAKYGLPTTYLSQDFTMDGFDDDSITLASAMTYNEYGLVINDYDGGYKYGDTVGTIDMNDEGVAMLEDMIFCTKDFAQNNPETVKADRKSVV